MIMISYQYIAKPLASGSLEPKFWDSQPIEKPFFHFQRGTKDRVWEPLVVQVDRSGLERV